jgi:hypothetical protein
VIGSLWFSPAWAEGLLVAAALVFLLAALLCASERRVIEAILAAGFVLVSLALLAF